MRPRGCLISVGALAALALICCLLLWFVGLPRFQDSIADGIEEGLSTEVSRQIERSGVDASAGTHTISMSELEQEFENAAGTQGVEDYAFTAENGEVSVTFGSQGQEFGYSGTPVAENGRLELTNVESVGGGFLDQFFPADKMAGAIEGGVNNYLETQGLELVSVSAENNELVLETREGGV